MDKKKLYNLIDKLVERRIQKVVPMLVEHEVNRMLREAVNSEKPTPVQQPQPVDTAVEEQKRNLREHFSALVGGSVSKDRDGSTTLSFNSNNVVPRQVEGLEGRPINTQDPNVQKIMGIMNRDYSGMMKAMDKKKQNKGFMPE